MKQYVRRVLQVLTGFSALWFFYWLFIYEMVVWQKPYPTSLSNILFLAISLLLFSAVSSSRLLGAPRAPKKRKRFGQFRGYMRSRSAYWYWITVLTATFTALLVLFSIEEASYLVMNARIVFGSIYILCFPGYALVRAILPRGELKDTERIALSLGMSFASVSFVGLLLAYSPWGVSIVPVTLSILAVTLASATTAILREYVRARW